MTKIGEYPLQRSDGDYDWIDLHELGTFDHDPVLVELSDGRRGTPYLVPLGEGDTGMIVQASDGNWWQARKRGILVIEDWETGDFRHWGHVGHGGGSGDDPTIVTSPTYEGSHALRGDAGEGLQNVRDNERDHNNLPHYQQPGETSRVMAYYPASEDAHSPIARVRWGFGGIYEDATHPAYYLNWNIHDSGLHLIDSSDHSVLASTYDFTYPGNEWWALEAEWRDPEIVGRLVDYSDRDNPVVQDSLSISASALADNAYRGHQLYVWTDTPENLYSDYAIVPAE